MAFPADHVRLATWPTPMEPAPRLAVQIGLEPSALWIKRDDLTGLGAGGNKIRKLEWTIAAALAEQADTVVTTGAPQSNHARLTAAAAARLGLSAVLVFPGRPPGEPGGNLVLDGLFGATVIWAGELPESRAQAALDAAADREMDRLRARGSTPALIPFGGSNAIGAHGYRLAAMEITQQLQGVRHVVCAVGSGGTMAGLVAALGADRVLGVHVGAVSDPRSQVGRLLQDMGEAGIRAESLRLRTDQVAGGYQTLAPGAARAMVLAARQEGLVLDPIYSARAMAGLVAEVAEGIIAPDDTVVFLASGGLPGLFGSPDAVALGADALRATDPEDAPQPATPDDGRT